MTLKQWIFAGKVGENMQKFFHDETDAGVLIYPQILCPISCEQIQASMSKFSVLCVVSESRVTAVANISVLYALIGVVDVLTRVQRKSSIPPVKIVEYSPLCHEPVSYRETTPEAATGIKSLPVCS